MGRGCSIRMIVSAGYLGWKKPLKHKDNVGQQEKNENGGRRRRVFEGFSSFFKSISSGLSPFTSRD